jgi:RNA polymerase sigma factor (sigma-70 family)
MDAYAHVLDSLSADGFRRLRSFEVDGSGKFTTWLVVVARRLAHDWHRQRYGRTSRADDQDPSSGDRAARRRLVDLAAEVIDLADIADGDRRADSRIVAEELHTALAAEIDALEPSDRLLIKLRFEDGYSAKAIAAATGSPTLFHVYRRLTRILATLRRGLVARGVESALL